MRRLRILLADDHEVLREGLSRLLEPQYEVVGTVGDGRSLVTEANRLRPDVVVFDIGMPILNGIEAARRIRETLPDVKLVALTQQAGKEHVQETFRIGVGAYVLKNAAAAELLTAIDDVLAGRYYISPELRQRYLELDPSAGRNPADLFGNALTSRQREVLQLIAEGKSAKEIAFILDISVRTVEFHKGAIMDELGLRSTAELTRYAIEQGVVQP